MILGWKQNQLEVQERRGKKEMWGDINIITS